MATAALRHASRGAVPTNYYARSTLGSGVQVPGILYAGFTPSPDPQFLRSVYVRMRDLSVALLCSSRMQCCLIING